jgi:hypothetical protein
MNTNTTTPKESNAAKQEAGGDCPSAPCSPLLTADTAPKDGTVILGAFGWPWLIPASWNEHDEAWTVCTLQASPMEPDNKMDSWFETDWEKPQALQGWMPIPPLPEGTRVVGFLSPANVVITDSYRQSDATQPQDEQR